MQYGTCVSESEWDSLMLEANQLAVLSGQRVKVRAGIYSDRLQKLYGRKYAYTAMRPTQSWTILCGKVAPNGKSCLLPKNSCTQYWHISIGNTKGKFLAWNYLSVGYKPHPVPYSTSSISCQEISAEEAKHYGVSEDLVDGFQHRKA